MLDKYKSLQIKNCDLGKGASVELETGEVVDSPECSSLNKTDKSKLPNFEVDTKGTEVTRVVCREFENCDSCRRRV